MENPRTNHLKNFALDDDSAFIGALVTRIAKEKEVTFRTFSGKEHVGFITGLDHEWVQLTTTEDCSFAMIQIVNIESFTETQLNLRSQEISKEKRERIREFAQIIYKKARTIYENRPARTTNLYRNNRVLEDDDDAFEAVG